MVKYKKHSKTILFTGAAGFIGSNVLEYFFKKYPSYNFIVLDALTYAGDLENISSELRNSNRFSFWYGDVQNAKLVDDLVAKSDIVIHFAAETHVTRSIFDNSKFFTTDVLGTQTIANAVLAHQDTIDRFIHISTCEVYGEGLTKKMDESHPLNPQSPYAAAKAGADRLVYSYQRTYGLPAVIVRPFNILGPRQHLEKVTPRFITSALLGEELTVHGSGTYSRDFMYVEDLARALDLIVHAPRAKVVGEVFNVGSGKALPIIDLATMIVQMTGYKKSAIKHVGDRPGQVSNFAADYGKIQKRLNWKPEVSIQEGLARTIEWYRANRPIWEKQMWMRQVPVKTAKGKTELH
ncbi:MAG TPA: GDP-mannose 4,6-dehydratase [Candidatus Paceibacterota bacterium]|nr:GDP-mannose 4,6-dehydratase [Candidatus Paceibacterota bacterium]